MKIEELHSTAEYTNQLAELLIRVVDDGASVGFLPPLEKRRAVAYWKKAVTPDSVLWIAKQNGRIAGSVQLHLCTKQNGRHRAEICKLMTDPAFRRQGIARSLMQKAIDRAKQESRSLLVLDTREGDPSNFLYTSLGFAEAGRIPAYAESADGGFDASVFYYKKL
ncbi:GNAT family N-acetyltransferase [Bacillus haynesii]|uniref:GNAT family N-acetyltransferase n=1 Tax=Bacillus haynesii TaxID=1925021 RepID=UPI002281801A|nr:GNAT family N-acetyltransferase [Bacillus haynesii]MCY7927732.1 GNAT family N-acetyltransferase [Bacillus haynesii]MCY8045136.1 GNAT family N-acetyltransferase [Bacillus haynesii]MCY8078131.1 GNAT family N-acetyltransferase [Bacillus haynesii]MCY8381684.1 GNAT family N-acetyltransferase [Bacillus haynesii]MCY8589441.1 GNAT family N-acetyltransferase [Bacillus haynesii]